MSSFVLEPPEILQGRVQIVSFFITARLAAQDTREAFTTVLLEQLADLTGENLPPALNEETREIHLLGMLECAAITCQNAGGRLILVLDGLDEDRGVTVGPDAHSIAALLPPRPPAGMRIIVAGRPDPPIPDDVPDHHPLRDPGIIRLLSDSPHARDLQRLSKSELMRFLQGTQTERDVLGLLTAAHGGLPSADLEELTGAPLWEIENNLHAVAGRTFNCRPSMLSPGVGPDVFLLGHEELHAAAGRYLGEQRLNAYQNRLHAWADTYRSQCWPPHTPEYLLSGYWWLLTTLKDLPRMTVLATDTDRHDHMLDLTGGDAAALIETQDTLKSIASQSSPDLLAAFRVAWHRDGLSDRNLHIPANLPAVWATLGHLRRAQALAHTIRESHADLDRRAWALSEMAWEFARAGHNEQACVVATEAEQVARAVTSPEWQTSALGVVAGALAKAGDHDRAKVIVTKAEQATSTITNSAQRVCAVAELAGALAKAGFHDRASAITTKAEQAARTVINPTEQAWALGQVAEALAEAEHHERAGVIASQAEQVAGTIAAPPNRAWAMGWVAGALAVAGHHDRAEQVARDITEGEEQAWALGRVAVALAEAGHHDRAEQMARDITEAGPQAWAFARVAGVLAEAGHYDWARAIAAEAEQVSRTVTNSADQAMTLAQLADALAGVDRVRSSKLVAEAWVATRAPQALKTLLKLEPAAVEVLKDLLETQL